MTAIDWQHKTHARSNCAILNYGAAYNTSVMTYYDNIPGLERNIEKIKRKLEAATDGVTIKKLEGLLAYKLATLAHLQSKKIPKRIDVLEPTPTFAHNPHLRHPKLVRQRRKYFRQLAMA